MTVNFDINALLLKVAEGKDKDHVINSACHTLPVRKFKSTL